MLNKQNNEPQDRSTMTNQEANTSKEGKERKQVDQIIELAQMLYTFGISTDGMTYAVQRKGLQIALPLLGRTFRNRLAADFYAVYKTAAAATGVKTACDVIDGIASRMTPTQLAVRLARTELGNIAIDLGDNTGRVIAVTPKGWWLGKESPILFRRSKRCGALPVPERGGSIDDLRELINVEDEWWDFLVAWLVAALIPDFPHVILLVRGEYGTGKTSTCKYLIYLLDPQGDGPSSVLQAPPSDERNLVALCNASWVIGLENISYIPPWLSNALCRLVHGESFTERTLYANHEASTASFRRTIILNGIEPIGIAMDLNDRLSSLSCRKFADGSQRAESQLDKRFYELWPGALGSLLDIVVDVMAAGDTFSAGKPLARMADFAAVLHAVDGVRGTHAYKTYVTWQATVASGLANLNEITIAFKKLFAAGGPLAERQMTDWFELLRMYKPDGLNVKSSWPRDPRTLSQRLSELAPSLRRDGWVISDRRTGGKTLYTIEVPAAVLDEFRAASSNVTKIV